MHHLFAFVLKFDDFFLIVIGNGKIQVQRNFLSYLLSLIEQHILQVIELNLLPLTTHPAVVNVQMVFFVSLYAYPIEVLNARLVDVVVMD